MSTTRACGGSCCTTTTTRRRNSSSGCSRPIFHMPHAEAFAIMMHVHQAGVGVAGIYSRATSPKPRSRPRSSWPSSTNTRCSSPWSPTGGAARMSRTPVPFAPDTLESIRRAFRVAVGSPARPGQPRAHAARADRGSAGARDPDALPRRPARRSDAISKRCSIARSRRCPARKPSSPNRRSASIASSSARWCTPPRRARSRSTAARCSCSCCRKRRATPRTSCASRASIG